MTAEQAKALNRYIVLLQDRDGYSHAEGWPTEPVMVEVVKLSDVLALLEEE